MSSGWVFTCLMQKAGGVSLNDRVGVWVKHKHTNRELWDLPIHYPNCPVLPMQDEMGMGRDFWYQHSSTGRGTGMEDV